jgi:phosphohistidine phosphatase
MRVYLMQHGEAKSEAEDLERSLTNRGEEETRKISSAVKKLSIRPQGSITAGRKGPNRPLGSLRGL